MLAGLVAAVVMLALVAVERSRAASRNDALLIKNLTFYFGHMLVNITHVLWRRDGLRGDAGVYRPAMEDQRAGGGVVEPDAAALVMFAYLHHLYMDFAQPQWVQVLGQLSSYLISVPAAVVTIFSALVLVYGSDIRWRLRPFCCFWV